MTNRDFNFQAPESTEILDEVEKKFKFIFQKIFKTENLDTIEDGNQENESGNQPISSNDLVSQAIQESGIVGPGTVNPTIVFIKQDQFCLIKSNDLPDSSSQVYQLSDYIKSSTN